MNDEELIWDVYHNSIITDSFDHKNIKVLNQYLKKFYGDSRIVFTNKEEIDNINIKQTEKSPTINRKPKGLWYSLGNEWADFLKFDAANWASSYSSVFVLDLNFRKILKIDTPEKLIVFDKNHSRGDDYVDWAVLQRLGYSGVEIIPYRGESRYSMSWYNGWDVASGCIWNSDCIIKSTKIFPRTKKLNSNHE